MMGSLYSATSGMKTHSAGLDVVANNLANVGTIGFKQQSIVFQDMFSQDLVAGSTFESQGKSQLGMGATVGTVRTQFTEGSYEPGNSITDLSIGGKGFFQVTHADKVHYTRAGNFRFDAEGCLRDPSGFALSGARIANGMESDTLEPIDLSTFGDIGVAPVRPTSQMVGQLNIGEMGDASVSDTEPFFALHNAWNGTSQPPLKSNAYAAAESMTMYDAQGTPHDLTLYVDGVSTDVAGKQVFEYVLTMNPAEDGSVAAGTPSAGMLMSGTLTFASNGTLEDMTAFTPDASRSNDLNTWTPAPIVNGLPQFTAQFLGASQEEGAAPVPLAPQGIAFGLGVVGSSNVWANAPLSAAAVGADAHLLPSLSPAPSDESKLSTIKRGDSKLARLEQDGLGEGVLRDIAVSDDGLVQALYTNNETLDLYRIPIFRFTSEDGLRHEGKNHFSATEDVGTIEHGTAGTENYGGIMAHQIEGSNVDMSREMVNMIVVQRGFQMNSKSVTTADSLLQKALELKRN